MGVYKSQLISVVNYRVGSASSAATCRVFSYSLAWYAFAIFTVVTTVLWGRLYCGRICAFGALTQLIDAVVPKRFQLEIPAVLERARGLHQVRHPVRRDRLVLRHREIAFYRYIEPFWLFTFDATPVLWIMVGVLLVASIFVRNLYCRFLCPLGAALGLVSKVDDGVRDQALVRVQPVRALREDLRMGRDPQAADHQDGMRALRRLRDPLRRQAAAARTGCSS